MESLARSRWCHIAATGVAAWLVVACGGGGDGQGAVPRSVVSPDEAVAVGITLDPPGTVEGTNRIALTWRSEGAPTSFDVFVQSAEGEAFVAVTDAVAGGDAAQFARGAAWHYDWPTARVRVRACDAQQRCADSNEQPLLDALAGGVVKLLPDPLPQDGGYHRQFYFSRDGSTLGRANGPLSMFVRASDARWAQDATAPARSSESSALSGDGRTLAIGLPDHRGTVGGIGAPEAEPPPGPDPTAQSRGAVAVYVRDAAGAWQQQSFLKADVPTDRDNFGRNVVLSGDGNRMAVGASGTAGTKIYLYEREAGVWRLAWQFRNRLQRNLDTDTMAVSADGRTIAVRVYGYRVVDNPGGYGDGDQIPMSMLHVYRQCACNEGWELAAEFESKRNSGTPLGSDDAYASALSLSADGRTLAVGAAEDSGSGGPADDGTRPNQASPRSGAVYVYGEGANRRWERRAFIKTSAALPRDYFGGHVQLRADGRALVASACGLLANAPGLRRLHRADALPPGADCSFGANFYVFEQDGEGQWKHSAAALVPAAQHWSAQMRASADLTTIGVQTFTVTPPASTGAYGTAVY